MTLCSVLRLFMRPVVDNPAATHKLKYGRKRKIGSRCCFSAIYAIVSDSVSARFFL